MAHDNPNRRPKSVPATSGSARPGRRANNLLALAIASCAGGCAAEPSSPPAVAVSQAAVATPAATPEAVDRRTPIVRTVERVGSAVVNISTEALVRNPYYGGSGLDWLFGQPQAPRTRWMPNSLGSGVIVDPEGHVITNAHVLAAASRVTVTLLDGRQVEAEFVGSAPEYDLAVLRLTEPGPYPFVSPDFDETLHPGEIAIAIGNPFGLQSTVTVGVLSGTHRRVESGGERYTDFLQTDAAINPGNSGGALLTVNGDLIGINTQIDARGQNLGFAIPVARVRKVLHDLVRYGAVQDVWLGLHAESLDLTEGLAQRLGVPAGRGMFVRSVMRDSPVARAGLLPGDVVLEIQGERVVDDEQWRTVLSRVRVGESVRLTAWRDGGQTRVEAVAERFPLERGAELAWNVLGLRVQPTDQRRDRRLLVISEVREGSEAWRIGFRPGLVLLGIDGEGPWGREEEFYRALVSRLGHASVLLAVSDGRQTYRVPMALE